MTTPTITTVRLTDLILDPEIQPRRRLDPHKIDEYADLYAARVEFPPIAVFTDDSASYVADGFHRTHAASKAGLETITAAVHEGTKRDALLFACTANSAHGLPLTSDDKRRVVTRLLEDPEWRVWSDNAIAKHCGVSHPFVATVRGSLESVSSETQPRTYTTKHGTTATMQTGRIGRSKAQPPAEDHAAPPAVLADGSSVLVQAPTPLEPGSAQPVDQHVPAWDLAAIVQASLPTLGEIGSQVGRLARDYRSCTDADGQPFASAWACITAPLPYGRGCNLDALLQIAAPLVTLLEALHTQAEPQEGAATVPPVEQVTKRQQVLDARHKLKPPFTTAQVATATGLPPIEARRALEGLAKVGEIAKVDGTRGQYCWPTKC